MQQNNPRRFLSGMAFLCMAVSPQSVSAPSTLNLGVLEVIQADTVLAEARLAKARAESELRKNGFDNDSRAFLADESLTKNTAPRHNSSADASLPQVVEISGTGKKLSATLLTLASGVYITVYEGSEIAGSDFRVKSIRLSGVDIESPTKGLFTLAFSG